MVIAKTSNNYREISGKNGGLSRPTIASVGLLVAIKVLWVDPSASLRLTNSGDGDCVQSENIIKMCPCRCSDMISTAAHETANSFISYNG